MKEPLNNIQGASVWRAFTSLSVHSLDLPPADDRVNKNTQSLDSAESLKNCAIGDMVNHMSLWCHKGMRTFTASQEVTYSFHQSTSLFYTFNKIYFFKGKLSTEFILENTGYKVNSLNLKTTYMVS